MVSSDKHRRKIFTPLLWSILGLVFWGVSAGAVEAGPSRAEIQQFFIAGKGDCTRRADWSARYLRQEVDWSGTVYRIERHPESMRIELLVKVLPDSKLYDTVVVLEGDTNVDTAIRRGSRIGFTGRIFRGVDLFGVKEVQVLVQNPQYIRLLEG
jgi:hypothetical protein